MATINRPMTAVMERPFVLFLIGMRINRPWRIDQWYPVASAMPRMLKELQANPGRGFLGGEMWGGRTTIMVQYWESFDALESYAKDRDSAHLPAWREFNRRIAASGDVGIWHETYLIAPGQSECVYNNMPPFGLGKIGKRIEATGAYATARARLQAR
jgi:hypothetical protein